MNISIEEFIERASNSGVVTREDAAACAAELSAELASELTVSKLADAFIRQRLLTPYQAECIIDGASRPLMIGRYAITDHIGKGGMGEVFKGYHRVMQRVVAVKVLHRHAMDSEDAVARFRQEVLAAGRLNHPNIVHAYDADEHNGVHFFVMEFVEGMDLYHMAAEGPLTLEMAVNCIIQAGRGLDYAHRSGVIHRDIKPGNLLRSYQGVVKVLDMGIARVNETNEHAKPQIELTQFGAVMGTVDFMSPEQAMNTKNADARADIYSLGCSLFYLLTSQPAYSGETIIEKIVAHRSQPMPSIQQLRPDVPNELNDILHKMMAKQPEDRYTNMFAVVEDLTSFARSHNLETPPASDELSSRSPPPPSEAPMTIAATGDITAGAAGIGAPPLSLPPVAPLSTPPTTTKAFSKTLLAFIESCGYRDKFIDFQEEDEIYRKGGAEGLSPTQVREHLEAKCNTEQWTLLSDLSPALLSHLEEGGEDGVTKKDFNKVVSHAAKNNMPRKEAIEHCLTLMLDNDIEPNQTDGNDWFDDMLTRFGLG